MDWKEYLYVIFRCIIGVLFFGHGVIKFFGTTPVPLMSILGHVAVFELIAGTLITLGVLTRVGALFGIVTMIGALFTVHLPQRLNIYANGGELAMLYLLGFLVILAFGGRKWSLKDSITGKDFW